MASGVHRFQMYYSKGNAKAFGMVKKDLYLMLKQEKVQNFFVLTCCSVEDEIS